MIDPASPIAQQETQNTLDAIAAQKTPRSTGSRASSPDKSPR